MKAADWIDRVKAARGLPSDYAVAQSLGVSRQVVSKYRGPIPTMDEEMAMKVAEALGVDPAAVIIDQLAERSKTPAISAALHKVADQLLYIMFSSLGYKIDSCSRIACAGLA